MYGLVNKAVEGLVRERFGEETGEEVKRKAGVDADVFVGMEQCPDDATSKLVAAASR